MGVETAMIAAAVIGTGSAIYSGQQQKKFNQYQADQAEADAEAEKGAAAVRADKIRKIARMKSGTARATMAAAGVEAGEGTALLIDEDILRGGELDALTAINDANDAAGRLRAEASALRFKGDQAEVAGYAQGASTALSAGSNYGKGWKGSTGSAHGTPTGEP